MLGRRRHPGDPLDDPRRRSPSRFTAINTVVQGSAADLIKLAMVDLPGPAPEIEHRRWRPQGRDKAQGAARRRQSHRRRAACSCRSTTNSSSSVREVGEQARAYVVHRMEHAAETWTPDALA